MKIKIETFVEKHISETKRGCINTKLPWFSPTDLQKTFGKSRQYWGKLIKQGKLYSRPTSAGPIVTTEDICSFFQDYLLENPELLTNSSEKK